ncbi:MAG: 30S ribosomal protein S17e [Asgard group archaeon]|nr:30S ribosomal protein S17e [Asgard group archaeon]
MGKIRSDKIKRTAKELVAKYHQHLSTEFDENKILVAKLTNVQSKRMRNRIAGYVTRIMVQIEDGKVQVIEKLAVGGTTNI